MKRKFLIILGLILTLSITACAKDDAVEDGDTVVEDQGQDVDSSVTEEEKAAEEDQDESDGEDSTTSMDDNGESGKWPSDFMPEAPKLKGDIKVVKEEGPNKYFLEFENIQYEDAQDYVDDLRDAGFNDELTEEANENMVKYKANDSNKNMVVFIWKKDAITKLELIKKDV